MRNLSTLNKTLLAIAIILIVASLVLLAITYKNKLGLGNNYYAVYLDSGDLYFGDLSTFPSLSLSHVWYLQRGKDGELSIQQFSKATWGPEDRIKLNRDKILWTAKLADNSPLIGILNGTAQQNATPSFNESGISPAPTSSPQQ